MNVAASDSTRVESIHSQPTREALTPARHLHHTKATYPGDIVAEVQAFQDTSRRFPELTLRPFTTDDRLRHVEFVDAEGMARITIQRGPEPHAFAVHGDWVQHPVRATGYGELASALQALPATQEEADKAAAVSEPA